MGTDGVMHVEAAYPPRSELREIGTTPNTSSSDDGPCLLLISGLNCGDPTAPSLPRDMLLSYLEGRFGGAGAERIGQIIVAGGLVAPAPPLPEDSMSVAALAAAKKQQASDRLAALRDVDAFVLGAASSGIPVDILPGKHDPTTANWPQRPLHRCLLPQSHRYFSASSPRQGGGFVYRTPNPFAAKLHGKDVIGTDGSNVADLKRHVLQECEKKNESENADNDNTMMEIEGEESDAKRKEQLLEPIAELDALRLTLQWSHLCPTGPNSVPTAPHLEVDPMVLPSGGDDNNEGDFLPSLYFSGNASGFATTLVGAAAAPGSSEESKINAKCRLICVPEFSKTGEAVLCHLGSPDMKVELLRFLPQ
jgi:DNA polymerase delta subunit 2